MTSYCAFLIQVMFREASKGTMYKKKLVDHFQRNVLKWEFISNSLDQN